MKIYFIKKENLIISNKVVIANEFIKYLSSIDYSKAESSNFLSIIKQNIRIDVPSG